MAWSRAFLQADGGYAIVPVPPPARSQIAPDQHDSLAEVRVTVKYRF